MISIKDLTDEVEKDEGEGGDEVEDQDEDKDDDGKGDQMFIFSSNKRKKFFSDRNYFVMKSKAVEIAKEVKRLVTFCLW